MKFGVPTEIKPGEFRVAMTPSGVRELVQRGHVVEIQAGAGIGSGIADSDYLAEGAILVTDVESLFADSEVIVKVKEPQPTEVAMLNEGQALFTYLHLAPDPELTRGLMKSGATCIAYETITDEQGKLPLLAPMSEVAGKLATQAGAFMLGSAMGGSGVLLGGVAGVPVGKVMVIGGGIVGLNAAMVAIGLGAEVTILDRSLDRLRELNSILGDSVSTCFATPLEIESLLPESDLVIGAVLIQGAKAPHVISRQQLSLMKPASVLVDVSIDQGGCFETSRPTTHQSPTFEVDGVSHYCVANMPGVVPKTSTRALTNSTLPFLLAMGEQGVDGALSSDPGFANGLNVARGAVTYEPVSLALAKA